MSERDEFSVLASVKKCPKCGGGLQKGYLNAPRGISWDTVKHGVSAVTLDVMMPRISSAIEVKNIPALKCERCEIAILDYSSAFGTPKSFLKKCVECGREIPIASEECSYCGAKQNKNDD